MIRISPGLRRIALEHFTGRLAHARKTAAQFGEGWPGDPANETLRLWLAIALAAGCEADLPADVRQSVAVPCLWPGGERKLPRPDQIAQPAAMLAELARARDVAIAKAESRAKDLKADQRARDLIALAEALGAPGIDWTTSEGRAAA